MSKETPDGQQVNAFSEEEEEETCQTILGLSSVVNGSSTKTPKRFFSFYPFFLLPFLCFSPQTCFSNSRAYSTYNQPIISGTRNHL